MNCADFAEGLDQLHEGRLSLLDQRAAVDHMEECSRCSRLFAASCGKNEMFGADALEALANSILGRTSGSACNRAREHLCDFVDGSLERSYIPLIEMHLTHCMVCNSLAGQLEELNHVLPEWAEIDPGPAFRPSMLRTAIGHPAKIRADWENAQRLWHRLIGRPRFSWEAAYAATLIFVVLAGNPAWSMGSAFLSRLGNTRMDAKVGLRTAVTSLPPQWIERGNKTILSAKKQASNILAFKQQFPPAIDKLEQTGEKWTTAALRFKNEVLQNLSSIWSNAAAIARHYLNPTKPSA